MGSRWQRLRYTCTICPQSPLHLPCREGSATGHALWFSPRSLNHREGIRAWTWVNPTYAGETLSSSLPTPLSLGQTQEGWGDSDLTYLVHPKMPGTWSSTWPEVYIVKWVGGWKDGQIDGWTDSHMRVEINLFFPELALLLDSGHSHTGWVFSQVPIGREAGRDKGKKREKGINAPTLHHHWTLPSLQPWGRRERMDPSPTLPEEF